VGKKTVKPEEQLEGLRELVSEVDDETAEPKKRTDRRGMLKIAGAAILGAAGMAAVRAVPAAAASGSYMITGCINTETTPTQISGSATNGLVALGAQGGIGLEGRGNATTTSTEVGVFGTTKSGVGTGVQGSATSGVGVQGTTTSGTAGWFQATTGYDVQLGQAISGTTGDPNFHGSGRLAMVGRTDVGGSGPNIPVAFLTHSTLFAGGHFEHELVRGNDGSIWASRYDVTAPGASNQFRWKRINSVRVDSADGLGTVFKPFRLIDSRSGAIKAPGSITAVQVTGTGTGTSKIPADAVAVMGNLTAVAYTGSGFLTIQPQGVAGYNPATDPSSVNFITGQYAIANSFVCGLNPANGKLQVYVGGPPLPGHSSHFIIDITAYLQ
jgi:hypothetical protein